MHGPLNVKLPVPVKGANILKEECYLKRNFHLHFT